MTDGPSTVEPRYNVIAKTLLLRIIWLTAQRSKLRPFWSPWRVEKIFGDQNSGERRPTD